MAKQPSGDRIELVYGSLDMLILRTLRWGPTHGHGIAKSIERLSEETLKVEHGSLYPALQRLEQEGWISAEWGVSKNNQEGEVLSPDRGGTSAIGGRDLALGALCAGCYPRSAARRIRGSTMTYAYRPKGHPRESGVHGLQAWIPAYAGMTARVALKADG